MSLKDDFDTWENRDKKFTFTEAKAGLGILLAYMGAAGALATIVTLSLALLNPLLGAGGAMAAVKIGGKEIAKQWDTMSRDSRIEVLTALSWFTRIFGVNLFH